jgi:hypothetical protein
VLSLQPQAAAPAGPSNEDMIAAAMATAKAKAEAEAKKDEPEDYWASLEGSRVDGKGGLIAAPAPKAAAEEYKPPVQVASNAGAIQRASPQVRKPKVTGKFAAKQKDYTAFGGSGNRLG